MHSKQPTRFIHSRLFDGVFFAWGWLPVFIAFVVVKMNAPSGTTSVLSLDGGKAILLLLLVVNFVHRHITFPLVYGDAQVFAVHSRRYFLLPIFFLGLTLIAAGYSQSIYIEGAPAALSSETQASSGPQKTAKAHDIKLFWPDASGVKGEPHRKVVVEIAAGSTLEQAAQTIQHAFAAAEKRPIKVIVEGDHLVFRSAAQVFDNRRSHWFALRASPRAQKELGLGPVALSRRHSVQRPLLALLVALSLLWTIYHVLMQKMGILRIYSRLANAGSAGLDRAFVFGWFIATVTHLAAREDVRDAAARASSVGRFLRPFFDALAPALAWAQFVVIGGALLLTYFWLKRDYDDAKTWHPPRLMFAASIVALFATLSFDLVGGYATLAFSHSIEYIAFVGVFTAKKYAQVGVELSWIGRLAQHPVRSVFLFALLTTCAFFLMRYSSKAWLDLYIVGSSFLHFLYDGWLWKVRKPSVALR